MHYIGYDAFHSARRYGGFDPLDLTMDMTLREILAQKSERGPPTSVFGNLIVSEPEFQRGQLLQIRCKIQGNLAKDDRLDDGISNHGAES